MLMAAMMTVYRVEMFAQATSSVKKSTEPVVGKVLSVSQDQIRIQSKTSDSPIEFVVRPPKQFSNFKPGDVIVVTFRWDGDSQIVVSAQKPGSMKSSPGSAPEYGEYGVTAQAKPAVVPAPQMAPPSYEAAAPQVQPDNGNTAEAQPLNPPVPQTVPPSYEAAAQQVPPEPGGTQTANTEQLDEDSSGSGVPSADRAMRIQEKLVAQFKLTKTTADHTDIITAGDVVELHKTGLVMCSTASEYAYYNNYAGGAFKPDPKSGAKDAFKGWGNSVYTGGAGDVVGVTGNACSSRKFVAGEKFWVTGVTVKQDGVIVDTYSDPYNDQRYYGKIKFTFPVKGSMPSANALVEAMREVMSVVPSDNKEGQSLQAAIASPPAAPAMAPPPPPADTPPATIALGQTKDQVIAIFGQPVRLVKLAGTTEIYFYKDMKITFVNGRVTNVQ